MGFAGVVMTDGLQMQAMTDHYSSAKITVKAVQAGLVVLLCPKDLNGAAEAHLQAIETGGITEARLDESVMRILELKQARGMIRT